MFTPSTKAEQGQHDENIHPDKRMDPFFGLLTDSPFPLSCKFILLSLCVCLCILFLQFRLWIPFYNPFLPHLSAFLAEHQ
jgi:hypothetical protein